MNRSVRAVLVIVFAVLLLTPFLIRKFGRPTSAGPSSANANPLKRYGFRLTESAKAAGLDFVHQGPTLDPKLAHIMPQVASMGAAVSVVDVRPRWTGRTSTSPTAEGRLRTNFTGIEATARSRTSPSGWASPTSTAPSTGVSMGAVWGDYDNDGFDDLFLYRWGRPELFHNDQRPGIHARDGAAGLPRWVNVNTAVWLDYDRDGLLDLFVAGYCPETSISGSSPTRASCRRASSTRTTADASTCFTIWATADSRRSASASGSRRGAGRSRPWRPICAVPAIRTCSSPTTTVSPRCSRTITATFREVGRETGVGFAPKSGMNASFGDVFNEGRFAIYKTNISEEGMLVQGNNLWVPKTARPRIRSRRSRTSRGRWASTSAAGAGARSSAI